ncbi:MAG TPA: hypothetical protein VJQ83_09905 [Tepidiformaceae bacterium]|nr:hypothetical protein [Tepidiformaceae bacterium]
MRSNNVVGPWGIKIGPKLKRWLVATLGLTLFFAAVQVVLSTLTIWGVLR